MGHVRFGFAAGCEAVAMLRRQQPDYSRATPPDPGLALRIYWAKGRTKGIAQKWKRHLYGGAKPPPSHPAAKPRPHQQGLLVQSWESQTMCLSYFS